MTTTAPSAPPERPATTAPVLRIPWHTARHAGTTAHHLGLELTGETRYSATIARNRHLIAELRITLASIPDDHQRLAVAHAALTLHNTLPNRPDLLTRYRTHTPSLAAIAAGGGSTRWNLAVTDITDAAHQHLARAPFGTPVEATSTERTLAALLADAHQHSTPRPRPGGPPALELAYTLMLHTELIDTAQNLQA